MFSMLDEGALSHNPATGAFIPTVTPLNDGTFIAAQQVGAELGSRDHVGGVGRCRRRHQRPR